MTDCILLVEDNDDLRDMIARTLRKAGYDVTEADNGQQALDMLAQEETGHPRYAVVLTDIVMGTIDGIEVLNTARSLPHAPEVILLTGHGSLETAIEAVRNNAFDYLLKPTRKAKLLERIAAAIEHYHNRQRQSRAVEIVRSLADFAEPSDRATHSPSPQDTPSDHSARDRYIQVGQLSIDTHRQEVHFEEHRVHVTPTEYLILACLASSAGRVVTFGDIVRRTHSYNVNESEAHDLLRSHIRNLRKKVDRRYIVSVYATGYMLVDPAEERDEPDDLPPQE
jgi:DNA-binding response OmpR family regulator